MSGRTFQVFTRQVLAMPMEGGWIIAEKFTSATVHSNEGRGRPSGYSAVEAPRNDKSLDDDSLKVGYCCCGCLALLWAAINIYMIVIGGVNECSIENNIRVYLIVQGCFNLVQLTLCASSICASARDKESILSMCLGCVNLILMLFFIAWTIAGSVWVWRSLGDWQDDHSVCNNAIIISAIIFVVLHYVGILLLCCCCTCMLCLACSKLEN